jgi:hypothetical protein
MNTSNPHNLNDTILNIISEYSNIKITPKKYKKLKDNHKLNILKVRYKCRFCEDFIKFRQFRTFREDGIIVDMCKITCKNYYHSFYNHSFNNDYLRTNLNTDKYGYHYQYRINEKTLQTHLHILFNAVTKKNNNNINSPLPTNWFCYTTRELGLYHKYFHNQNYLRQRFLLQRNPRFLQTSGVEHINPNIFNIIRNSE